MTTSKPISNSYHASMEKGKKREIEMPPLPQETEPETQNMAEQSQETGDQAQPVLEESLQQDTQVLKQETLQQPQPETAQAKNFRVLREKAERVERERDELLRKFQEMEVAKNSQQMQQPEEEFAIKPDDLVEGKHLSKIEKKYKKLEQELASYKKEASILTTESRLKAQFPDFDKVVSKDNIDALKLSYPELASTLNSSTDLYNTAVSAYTLIKKLGIHTEDLYEADRALAQKNAAKPKPLASISPQQGDTPLSKANAFANGLTDELKLQLHKEMMEAMKNR